LNDRDLVLVSHANPEDNLFARWLTLRLAAEGYRVWCDVTKLLGGETFWDDIQRLIKQQAIKFLFSAFRLRLTVRNPTAFYLTHRVNNT
jgi:hypothetical protein